MRGRYHGIFEKTAHAALHFGLGEFAPAYVGDALRQLLGRGIGNGVGT